MIKHVLALSALSLALLGCGGGAPEAVPVAAQPQSIAPGCATANVPDPWSGEDYTRSLGDYTVSTSTWNKQRLTDWQLCVRSASLTARGIAAEFYVDWLTDTLGGVRAMPNVSWTPDAGVVNPPSWFGSRGLTPRPISDLAQLTLHHDVDINYSAYTQTWYSFAIDPRSYRMIEREGPALVEMGINLHPLAQAPDNVIDTVVLDGRTYWVQSWTGQAGGQTLVSLAFQGQAPYFKGSIRLEPFVQYIRDRNLLPANYYLHNLQLGSETFSGGRGSVVIREFAVTRN